MINDYFNSWVNDHLTINFMNDKFIVNIQKDIFFKAQLYRLIRLQNLYSEKNILSIKK